MIIAIPDVPIIRTNTHVPHDEARRIQRRATPTARAPNDLVRVTRGVYTTTDAWRTLDERRRHCLLVAAMLPRLPPESIVSHLSAAALMSWPHVGTWPDRVFVHARHRSRVDHRATMVIHPVPEGLESTLVSVGPFTFRMTAPSTTAAELARTLPFREAVVILDHALRTGVSRAEIAVLIESFGHRCSTRGHRALEFATPLAGSPGESLARAQFASLGAPRPVLQQPFQGPDGSYAEVDFWFPDARLIVEFDGEAKYRDPRYLHGRSSEQAVIDEKYREDWLRALPDVDGFVRFRWWDLWHDAEARRKLRGGGLVLPS